MAKTKGSNPPVNQFSYRDADGTDHYLGEFLRSVFREGSLSRYNPEEDITGLSQRVLRPGQQGPGTPEQEQIRDNFIRCAALWNSLPENTPEEFPDYPITTKESVWDAKIEFGVVCSYYDLFMRCCLNWAQAHNNEMPDGDCFPAISPCDCTGISISYTTQGMQVNEVQSLGVVGAIAGCEYSWNVVSGGGSLSGGSGLSVDYTAPGSNANCESNAVISLSFEDEVCDTLQIATNAYTGSGYAAYLNGAGCFSAVPNGGGLCGTYVCGLPYCWQCCVDRIYCDGSYGPTTYSTSCWDHNPTGCWGGAWCGMFCSDTSTQDTRTDTMKTQGCCPAKLL